MALIKCAECGKDVSEKAGNCPFCGNPIANHVEATKTVEIEQTNKTWKKTKIWAVLLLFIGIGMLSRSQLQGLGILLIIIAVIMLIVSRMGAWWTNG